LRKWSVEITRRFLRCHQRKASAHVGRLVIAPEENTWLSWLGRHRSFQA
jgi:hypothetical protein